MPPEVRVTLVPDTGTADDERAAPRPEEDITLFAVRLALVEKAASGFATLAFIWATVVVLGGFATSLETVDFWIVTIISLIEGTVIVRRNREVAWQHQATSKVQLIPYTGSLSRSKNVSRLFFWLQLLSVLTCAGLSLYSLVRQYYGVVDSTTTNRQSGLNIFYGLSLAHAILYLLMKVYWYCKIDTGKLFQKVNEEWEFNHDELEKVLYFFYATYLRCINGSVLDGLKMELVSYSVDLLLSSGSDTQLRGAQVLSALAKKEKFREETLRAIGAMPNVLERLMEMLNWKHVQEQKIRRAAAEIVSKMVEINWNRIRVTAIAGYMESIASLLYDSNEKENHSSQFPLSKYDYSGFSQLGVEILKSLVKDKETCVKIGSSICVLPKIIGIIELNLKSDQNSLCLLPKIIEIIELNPNNSTAKLALGLMTEIGKMRDVLKSLVEMLKRTNHDEQVIRIAAAKIISILVGNGLDWNCKQLMAINMSIESIGSLLYDDKTIEMNSWQYRPDAYDYSGFSQLGLQILKSLVLVEHQASKSESFIDLLPRILGITKLNPSEPAAKQIETVKLALELFTDITPSLTLKGMEKIALGISNLAAIFQYGVEISLQILAIDTLNGLALKSLALRENGITISEANEGAFCDLLSVFLMEGINNNEETRKLVAKAGKALDYLSRKNKDNCQIIMNIKLRRDHANLIASLISLLDDQLRGIAVARILRNLCVYAEADCVQLRKISAAAAQVVVFVMEKRNDQHQEAAIGLAAQIFKLMKKTEFDRVLEESRGVTSLSLISELLEVFRRHPRQQTEIRRFSLELLASVIKVDKVAILNSMSKEVRIVLRRKLKEGSVQSEVFSFLLDRNADEYFPH